MFLSRDQKIACDVARQNGYNPSTVISLTSHHTELEGTLLSVAAVKDGARHNLRVLVQTTNGTLVSADKLTVVFKRQSQRIHECAIDVIERAPVLLKE